ncbi:MULTISPECIES: DUF4244 domain-containing protein [Amycolatopsis]|uniref:DUF4244 domain-containing protein n=2 Tax=Amycolatopsis TaxID=1813 RepID=A0A1I4CD35_9PSEU|nr:DUF4244 domain-containing protein [Amycolatopsis sacchari]SFK77931.1 Protein of unknown function [Amycolatopsis sacchari]
MYWQATGRHSQRKIRWWRRWLRPFTKADDGMSTVEYAIGTVAAAAIAAVLYSILSGDTVVSILTNLIMSSLSLKT